MIPYDPKNWYWRVGNSADQVWSSAAASFAATFAGGYLSSTNAGYIGWVAAGGQATNIASESELCEVIYERIPALVPSYRVAALAALAATDDVAMRCFKANVPFPEAWRVYVKTLRDLARDATRDPTQPLPSRPAYPSGT